VNVPIDDIYNILNLMTFIDGRKSLRGNIPMNGYRAVGAANAVDNQDYVTLGQLQSLLAELSQVPTGIMTPLSGTTIPQGWVRANGQSLSRASYPALWTFAQTSGNLAATEGDKTAGQYGPGNGATTFTVPNLEADGGYFIRPTASGRGIGTVQADDFKSHTHSASSGAAGAHNHTSEVRTGGGSAPAAASWALGGLVQGNPSTSSAPDHTHPITVDASGGGETRPKNIAYPFIIKT